MCCWQAGGTIACGEDTAGASGPLFVLGHSWGGQLVLEYLRTSRVTPAGRSAGQPAEAIVAAAADAAIAGQAECPPERSRPGAAVPV